jgi:transposase
MQDFVSKQYSLDLTLIPTHSKMRETMSEEQKDTTVPLFKPYNQNQQMLLPPDLNELIPRNHLVRVVSKTIDAMNIKPLIESYKGGGSPSYAPKMLLKLWIYGYISQVYTCRKLHKALLENVYFMWLAGQNRPDFRTLQNFRLRLKSSIEEIFASLLSHLIDLGYIKLEHYFVDGTKMVADANKYSYVWKKNTERYSAQVQEKIRELLKQIDDANTAEDQEYGNKDLDEMGEDSQISSDRLQKIAQELDRKLDKDSAEKKELSKAKRKIERDYLPRLKKYEQQKQNLGERNSFSKTDKDATFFRFKNDELLPAYNILAGTENQFFLNWSIHQHPTDTVSFIPHMDKLSTLTSQKPKIAVGDSGFGSEENYNYLQHNGIDNFLKYNTFHRDLEGKLPKNPFDKAHFTYDEEINCYICPQGRRLPFKETQESKTDNNYLIKYDVFQCTDCSGCPNAADCKKTEGKRTVRRRQTLDRYRRQAFENLTSFEGVKLRKQRNIDVESVFGHIKHNLGIRRFKMRGLGKVNIEMGLICIAHNIKKMFNQSMVSLQPA